MRNIDKSINPRVSQLTKYDGNGEPLGGAIEKFIQALKKHIRGIEFGVKNGNASSKVYAYMQGNVHAMGWVAYADYRHDPEQPILMYTVCSHTITNAKYSYGEQSHMYMSKNLDVGIRNAKRYLRNLTTKQIALADKDAIQVEFRKPLKKTSETIEEKKNDVLPRYNSDSDNMKSLKGELKHLVAIGHEWVDQSYGEKLREFIKAFDEQQEMKHRTLDVVFVRAFNKLGKTMFETLEMANLNNHHTHDYESEVVTYDDTTLPVELAGKISNLNMLGQGQYVEGVGLYHGDNMYYVVK